MHLSSFLLLTGPLLVGSPTVYAKESNSSRQNGGYELKQSPLTTGWTDKVGTEPWQDYPRPQMQRPKWQNLNGVWRYQKANGTDDVDDPPFGETLPHAVLVPSCLESGLSGIMESNALYSWFATNFTVPESWSDQQILLNFDAVDYEATVFVNQKKVGFHRGGYFHFTVDVTSHVSSKEENQLLMFVHDPTDDGDSIIPNGKQTLRPRHVFYTPCSGIWQTVWMEPAPKNHIARLDLDANMEGQVNMTVHTATQSSTKFEVSIFDNDKKVAKHKGTSDEPFDFTVSSPKLWSPDSPTLYNITVRMGHDQVSSYTGFRTIAKEEINGLMRPVLNGETIFIFGTLDHGYWPDGIYTPPTREAMEYDLKMLKSLGFNTVRKHIKVEPPLFYRACDEMGLLVIQDMPSMRPLQTTTDADGNVVDILPNEEQQNEFERQLDVMVNQFKSYPGIIIWVIYNEKWGQITEYYPEFALTARVKQLDPSRLVDSTSGWEDHGAGDFSDNHHYATPQCGTPFYSLPSRPFESSRIALQGEFGGVGQNMSIDHVWDVQQAVDSISQTYELSKTTEIWNYRSHVLLKELEDQTRRFACSGGIWTQTTDVEGEVNGLVTYDRRVQRADESMWRDRVQSLYHTARARVHEDEHEDKES